MNKIYQKSFSVHKNAGFTLIELLVVVLIIGILSAVALPQYQKAVVKSRAAALLPWAKKVYDAQQMYFMQNGKFAANFEELGEDFSDSFPVKPSDFSQAPWQLATSNHNMGKYPYGVRIMTHGALSGAVFNQAMISGYGGLVYKHSAPYQGELLCWEYACHVVQDGSFCQKIMGYSNKVTTGSCYRLYRKD